MRKTLEKEIQDQILIALGTMSGMAIWRSAERQRMARALEMGVKAG